MSELVVEVENKIAVFDKFEAELVEFENNYKGLVYDFDDVDQAEDAKQNKKDLRKSWNALEVLRKAKKEKAESAAKEKERAARKEVERLQSIADKETAKLKAKQENQNHRAKIHKEIKESLMELEFIESDEELAIGIVKAIMSSEIKNVTINY